MGKIIVGSPSQNIKKQKEPNMFIGYILIKGNLFRNWLNIFLIPTPINSKKKFILNRKYKR